LSDGQSVTFTIRHGDRGFYAEEVLPHVDTH
jgi:cold shock CspA family protein